MYQQGYPEGPNGNGQERAWYAAPPKTDAAAPRRRSRSRSRSESSDTSSAPSAQAAPSAPAGRQAAPASQQQPMSAQQSGYGFASNGMSHPADQQGTYAASYSSYTAPNGIFPQSGYQQANGYSQQGGYGQQGGYQSSPYSAGYQQTSGYPQSGYPELNGYHQQNVYQQTGNGYGQQNYQQPSGYGQNWQGEAAGYGEQSSYGGYPQQSMQTQAPETPAYSNQNQQEYQGAPSSYEQSSYGSGYRPPQGNNSQRTASQHKGPSGGGPSPNLRNLLISVITLLVVAAGVILLVTAMTGGNPDGTNNPGNQPGTVISKSDASAYATKFLPNVYVDGICLADMTYQEGSDAVWTQAQEKQSGWYVRLKNENGSYKDITADMLGISFDPTSALQQAWAIGHTPDENGQVTDKALQQAVTAAMATEYHFTSAQQSADTSPIDTILDTLQTNAYRAPQDAVILSFNPDDFVNPFTFQEEVWGQWLDISAVKQEILNLVSTLQSGEVLLQITPIAPNVTVADLQKTVTLRCRAVTPISSNSTEDRTNNIRVAFSKINGKSLAHGDKFSFNKFVGRRSKENGFYEAIEYAYGEEVMGVGGGVCQASTTVYLAAIQSGMTITNREAHSNPVNYTSLGMDATVSDTRGREVDFSFKNESGGRIFIAAHVVESGSNRRSLLCEVRIYGPSLEDVHYKLESETIEILPKPEEPKLKEDKNGENVFYIDETKIASKGREGYVVETYLCTYQGDTLISREKISKDTYPARQDVYWVGVNER